MKIGVALGGGGARGAAHIGLIEAFERRGKQPDVLTGTSIGGLLAGLWAAGLDSEAILDFLKQFTLTSLVSRSGSSNSLIGNSRLQLLLEQTLGRRPTFAELELSLAVVAVDLQSRQEVVLDEGDVITALLATSAFPVLLPPILLEGRLLVDGGILNDVPFDTARARGAARVIAMDLSNSFPYGTVVDGPVTGGLVGRALAATQRIAVWQVLSAVTDILTTQSVNARLAISRPDLLIRPNVGTIGLFDFHRWEEGLIAGQEAVAVVEEALDELLG